MNVILCAGISVRSGTNYMGSIFSELGSVDSVPNTTSKGEFPFFPDRTFKHYEAWVKGFQSTFFASPNISAEKFAPYFANGFVNYLQDEYNLKTNSVFLKNPSLYNLENFNDFFPNGKLIILTRSAPDLIASSLKASTLIRHSKSNFSRFKSKFKFHSGYNMYSFSKAYVNHANQLLKLRKELKGEFLEVKYEDIVANPEKSIKKILEYTDVVYSEAELQNAVNAKVVGSSYFGRKKHVQNWGKLEKTSEFKSVGRYQEWGWFNRWVYNKIASKSNSLVGYTHKL
jgi:hypothetical protein